jgi:trans-aconitate methyltransferase
MQHTEKELIEKYNAYYRADPNKWAHGQRNGFAFTSVSKALNGMLPKNCLDIGCGVGHTLVHFQERWPQVDYYGIDFSDEAIRLSSSRVRNAKFHCGFLGDTNPFDQPFELILMLGVMEHLEDLELDLKRVRALLAPGGICYTEIPNCIGYPTTKDKREGFRQLNVGNRQYEWHLFRPTWDARLLEAGFEIVESLTGPSVYMEFCYILKGKA